MVRERGRTVEGGSVLAERREKLKRGVKLRGVWIWQMEMAATRSPRLELISVSGVGVLLPRRTGTVLSSSLYSWCFT